MEPGGWNQLKAVRPLRNRSQGSTEAPSEKLVSLPPQLQNLYPFLNFLTGLEDWQGCAA